MANLSCTTRALEEALSIIRSYHPGIRPAIIVIYQHLDRRGHYWAESWLTPAERVDEIHLSSLILSEGPRSVLRTLLHECAHSIAHTQNIQDTSREGRWHNGHFASIAQSLGLITESHPVHGHLTTGLTTAAEARYAKMLEDLTLDLWQESPPPGSSEQNEPKGRLLKAACSCGRIIRLSKMVFEQGPITCSLCSKEFSLI